MRFVLDLDRRVTDNKVISGASLLEPLSGTERQGHPRIWTECRHFLAE